MNDPDSAQFEGLGDIVSNLMALFILLTMVVLVSEARSLAETAQRPGMTGGAAGEFTWRQADPISRPSAYIVVMDEGVGLINFPAVVGAMAARRRIDSSAPLGDCLFVGACTQPNQVKITALRARYRDPTNQYEVRFEMTEVPSYARIPYTSPEMLQRALSEIVPPETVFTFFVYPDGLTRFAPIYAALMQQGACFRWEPWTRNDPINLKRGSLLGKRPCPI